MRLLRGDVRRRQAGSAVSKLQMHRPHVAMAGSSVRMADQSRNPEAVKRVRGSAWMATRDRWFKDHPLCVECLRNGIAKPANRLDHIQPLIDGGLDDESNYQSLCALCHDVKTAEEARCRAR